MSDDEYDDLDPLFNDPTLLATVDELESALIAASQVPKPVAALAPASTQTSFTSAKRHFKVAKPGRHGQAPTPAPVATVVEDDYDYDAFPDFVVDEDGHYELKDTRYPVATARSINAVAGPSRLPAVAKPAPPPPPPVSRPIKSARPAPPPARSSQLGNRGPLARSASMGSQGMPLSQGSINRMNAIRQASQSPVLGPQKTNQLPVPPARKPIPIDESAAAAKVRVMEEQVKAMQVQLELAQKARHDEAEKRKALEATSYVYQGEAANMRRVMEEVKEKHIAEAAALQRKLQDQTELMRQKEAENKLKLDAMSSTMVFKTHNIMQSAARQRPVGGTPQSQARPPPPKFGIGASTPLRGTPLRGPVKAMLPAPAQHGEETPLARRTAATPAISRRGFPQLQNGFESTGFLQIQNGFEAASPAPAKRVKTAKSPSRGPASSPLKRTPKKGRSQAGSVRSSPRRSPGQSSPARQSSPPRQSSPLGDGDVEMDVYDQDEELLDDGSIQALDLNDHDEMYTDLADEKAEVLHVIFASRYPNRWLESKWQKGHDPPALQQIMHCDYTDAPLDKVSILQEAFSDLLLACGKQQSDADRLANDSVYHLMTIADTLIAMRKYAESIATLALLSSVVHLRPYATSQFNKNSLYSCLEAVSQLLEGLQDPKAIVEETPSGKVDERDVYVDVASRLNELLRAISWVASTPVELSGPPSSGKPAIQKYLLALIGLAARPQLLFEMTLLLSSLAQRSVYFRLLLWLDPERRQSPLLDKLCKLLQDPISCPWTPMGLSISLGIIDSICLLAASDGEAVILLGKGASTLVPTLVVLLWRESSYIWGLQTDSAGLHSSLTLLVRVLTLLHFLILPPPLPLHDPPADGKPPPGIHLMQAVHSATPREFNGLQRMLIAAIGRTCYARLDGGGWSLPLLQTIQDLSLELLDCVIQGPEVDALYEVFVTDEGGQKDEEEMEMTIDDEEATLAAEGMGDD